MKGSATGRDDRSGFGVRGKALECPIAGPETPSPHGMTMAGRIMNHDPCTDDDATDDAQYGPSSGWGAAMGVGELAIMQVEGLPVLGRVALRFG
eukprot:CAMPEP_0182601120 /NCGR_PEP_ID=MMETSP1324-20130603/91324_1 /TAXON_ID=236786 /ORGANISM="Florenciella sp., Strain RCC1587" /LENGTH=93 /DNA_ID=CAMNT_0024819029 /DNA_START=190 /DNA_END=470 /DNA_ORIENTATION=+